MSFSVLLCPFLPKLKFTKISNIYEGFKDKKTKNVYSLTLRGKFAKRIIKLLIEN